MVDKSHVLFFFHHDIPRVIVVSCHPMTLQGHTSQSSVRELTPCRSKCRATRTRAAPSGPHAATCVFSLFERTHTNPLKVLEFTIPTWGLTPCSPLKPKGHIWLFADSTASPLYTPTASQPNIFRSAPPFFVLPPPLSLRRPVKTSLPP